MPRLNEGILEAGLRCKKKTALNIRDLHSFPFSLSRLNIQKTFMYTHKDLRWIIGEVFGICEQGWTQIILTLVKIKTSEFGLSPPLGIILFFFAIAVIVRPKLNSLDSVLCPPTILQPSISSTLAAPNKTW